MTSALGWWLIWGFIGLCVVAFVVVVVAAIWVGERQDDE